MASISDIFWRNSTKRNWLRSPTAPCTGFSPKPISSHRSASTAGRRTTSTLQGQDANASENFCRQMRHCTDGSENHCPKPHSTARSMTAPALSWVFSLTRRKHFGVTTTCSGKSFSSMGFRKHSMRTTEAYSNCGNSLKRTRQSTGMSTFSSSAAAASWGLNWSPRQLLRQKDASKGFGVHCSPAWLQNWH